MPVDDYAAFRAAAADVIALAETLRPISSS
jgi:hypothetical protein